MIDYPHVWKTRWDIIGYDREEEEREKAAKERARALLECAGPGNCHGSLSWCPYCGDVVDVCHVFEWPDRCDMHERYPAPPEPDSRQLVLVFPIGV